jgi:hypothetical protein
LPVFVNQYDEEGRFVQNGSVSTHVIQRLQ